MWYGLNLGAKCTILFASLIPIAKDYYSKPDLSIHTKVKHIIMVEVVYNKHTATVTITRHEFMMQVPAHTTLVRDSKQAMATTSTLLRYIIVVAPEVDGDAVAVVAVAAVAAVAAIVAAVVTASQGPSSATLQIANSLPTPDGFGEVKEEKIGFPYQLLPQQPSLLLTLR